MVLSFPECRTLGDIGLVAIGTAGQRVGSTIQYLNFMLFLPVAMQLCADSLRGGLDPSHSVCAEYWRLFVALQCLMTMQLRSMRNAIIPATVSLVCTSGLIVILIGIVTTHNNPARSEALSMGNKASSTSTAIVKLCLGISVSSWMYAPSFLTAELSSVMNNPVDLSKSLVLSVVVAIGVFLGVGLCCVTSWGWIIPNPIYIASPWGDIRDQLWPRVFNMLLFIANLVSYGLSAMPLGLACFRAVFPESSEDDWSIRGTTMYLMATLPAWLFGLVVSVFVPSLFDMLAFATAMTTPWATQIFPAVAFWYFKRWTERGLGTPISKVHLHICRFVFVVGIVTFVLCMVGAVGQVSIASLRGEPFVGCDGWVLVGSAHA